MLPAGLVLEARYEIEALAGVGGVGSVYRARDLDTGDHVAVKVLHAAELADADVTRFATEVSLLHELSHPGIVSYAAHGRTDGGLPFLVMAWIEGESLADRLLRAPISPRETVAMLEEVARALDEAHRRAIVHRDIKPANILLRDRDLARVVLVDFGFAKRTGAALSWSHHRVGTPQYMAPEVAWGSRDVGPAADIFSLGCIAFECLAGHPPFVAEDLPGTLTKLLFRDAPPLRGAGLPESVDRLVGRMLSRAPEDRPRDACALLPELEVASKALAACDPRREGG
jgi:serine/threonine protein kinase